MMNEEVRLRRVKALKTLAQRVIDHAEDFVGTTDMMGDLSVTITLPSVTDVRDNAPTIDISRTYYSRKATCELFGYEDLATEDEE